MTTSILLSGVQNAPDWYAPVNIGGEVWVPLGSVTHTRRSGEVLDGILVVALGVALGGEISLRIMPASTPVYRVLVNRVPHPSGGDEHATALDHAYKLGKAICERKPVSIGYCKAGAEKIEPRRLDELIPTGNGQGIVAHDLERGAPRSFRLDRISWVRS